VREIHTLRSTWRELETGLRRTYTGTKLETAETAMGSLRGTAPVLDPNRGRRPLQKGLGGLPELVGCCGFTGTKVRPDQCTRPHADLFSSVTCSGVREFRFLWQYLNILHECLCA
jgi:hypothetical protein